MPASDQKWQKVVGVALTFIMTMAANNLARLPRLLTG